jgi:3'-5' exoribonuclease
VHLPRKMKKQLNSRQVIISSKVEHRKSTQRQKIRKKTLISEIRELNEWANVSSCFCVKYRMPVRPYKNGFRFDVALADKSGEMELTYWGERNEKAVQAIYDSFVTGDIVYVSGTIGEYQGEKKICVNKGGEIRRANRGEYTLDDFIVRTNRNIEGMWSEIAETKDSLQNSHLKNLLNAFFIDKTFVRGFKRAPAAIIIHHACVGGLLEHTWEVLKYCKAAASVHPSLDKSLLFTGAILHDVGKIQEYNVSMTIRQSKKGFLLGHTFIGTELVLKKISEIPDFPPFLKDKLIHMILSHSGKEEYGAGQEPKLPEAAALHYADEMGAKITQYIRAKKDAATDDFKSPWNKRIGSVFLK